MVIRILMGGFSAVIFTCLIFGGFLQGDLFPVFMSQVYSPATAATGFWAWLQRFMEIALNQRDTVMTGPNAAKLVIWSLVAGFSERLLPDSFSRLESNHQPTTPRRHGPVSDPVTDDTGPPMQ